MKSSDPTVSVVLPVFNGSLYLKEAIDSVLKQSFVDFEFIIIDDGSVDESLSIIRSFKDERITVITRENRGLIYSLNEGISLSKGKYIARMDADDICMPLRFQKQVEFLENNGDIDVVGSYAQVIVENNLTNRVLKQPCTDNAIKAKLFVDSPFIHPSLMLRKECLCKAGGYPLNFHRVEDFALWVLLSESSKFCNLPEVLLQYRVLESSETRLNQKDISVRHESLRNVFYLLFELRNIECSKAELDNYTFSMFRPNFNLVDLNLLKNIYNKILRANMKYSNDIYRELSVRWIGVLYYNKKLFFSEPRLCLFSKFSFSGLNELIIKRSPNVD